MKIEELLVRLTNARKHYDSDAFSTMNEMDALSTAIITGWNAGADVLRRLIEEDYYVDTETSGIGWYCSRCGDGMNRKTGDHTPENCLVAAAQAVLARMTGLHDEPDVV